jgi:sacsin
MTDFPMVISTDVAAMLDPHLQFTGTNRMGWDGDLAHFLSHSGHASCLDKFDGLVPGTCYYNGTLFRFPLRTRESESKIAKDAYPEDRVRDFLYPSFISEAPLILLFLKSLVKITLYDNDKLVCKISMDQDQVKSVCKERQALINIAQRNSSHHLLRVYSMSVKVNESGYHWLIVNSIGSTDADVIEKGRQQESIPWVGIAAPLPHQINLGNIAVVNPCNISEAITQVNRHLKSTSFTWCDEAQGHMKGQVFCFLPLPNTTNLPVNIHGYFAVSDNRRSIEWPAEDNMSPKALWNKALLDKLIAPLYSILLACRARLLSYINTPLPVMSSQGPVTDPYSAWPLMSNVRYQYIWNELIRPVIDDVIRHDIPVMWSPVGNGTWVSISKALYLGHNVPDVVIEVLVRGNYHVVSLPVKIRETIFECNHKDLIMSRTITPAIARNALRGLSSMISGLEESDAMIMLDYVLSDINQSNYSELSGIKLLPLATTKFQMTEFKNVKRLDDCLFVVNSSSLSVLEFLNGVEHSIVSTKLNLSISNKLLLLARNNFFQLRVLSLDVISSHLLPKSMMTWSPYLRYHQPLQWRPGIHGQPSLDWISKVWAWIIRNPEVAGSLTSKGLPILPMEECTSTVDSVTLLPLPARNELSYFVKKRYNNDSVTAGLLQKLGATVLSYNSFIFESRHSVIWHHIHNINIDTLLKYIKSKNKVHLTDLRDEDKCSLRTEIIQYYSTSRRDSSFAELIKRLPIFEAGVGANVTQLVCLNPSYVLPSHFISFDTSLNYPPNILSNSDTKVILFIRDHLGFRCSDYKQICQLYVLPFALSQIRSSRVWCNGDELFVWAAKHSKDFVASLKDESFIRTKANPAVLKKASELYDINDDQFKRLFVPENDPVFPCEVYQAKDVMTVLYSFGLITWRFLVYNGDRLVSFIEERAQAIPSLPFSIAVERSHYIMELINFNHSFAAKIMAKLESVPFLLFQKTRPNGYPISLKWAGETQRQNVQFESPCNIYFSRADPNLIGSVSPILAATYVLPHNFCNYFKRTAINDVLTQFHTLVKCIQRPVSHELNEISAVVYSIYKYLDDSGNSSYISHLPTSWVWWSEDGHQYAFLPLTKFVWSCELSLDPYVYSLASNVNLHAFKNLFNIAGICPALSLPNMIDILRKIASDHPQVVPEKYIKMAVSITMYLAEQKYESKGDVYLPTTNNQLFLTSECTYDDREWIRRRIGAGISKYKFVHGDIPARIAQYFGVDPLSKKVAPSQKLALRYKQVGPKEKVTRRIGGIVKDYSGNIDVFKELIQNADDAKAAEIKLLIDWRKHNTDTLLDENMKHWQGPAVVAYNNAKFSDQDFDNICELAAETKMRDPLKTGRFGVGFCACYSLTDVPSFLSRSYLTIFDPHTKYLNERVSHNEPGMRINVVDTQDDLRVYEDQFAPFDGLFGCDIFNLNGDGYDGTIFRFPLRMPHFPSSEISHKDYTGHTINDLLSELKSEAPHLLLFLKHIQSLQVYILKNDAKTPSEMVLQFQVQKQLNDVSSRLQIIQNPRSSAYSCSSFTIKVLDNAKESSARYLMSSYVSDSCTDRPGLISLAELVLQLSDNEVPDPITDGYVFCFLPLPIKSELPFHVNGFFDVGKDRRGLKEAVNSPEYAWNESLVVNALPIAFINALARLCKQLRLNPSHMTDGMKENCLKKYYALWPGAYSGLVDTSRRHIHSWVSSVFADAVRRLLISSNEDIIWSDVDGGKWVSPQDVYLFSDNLPAEIKKEAIGILLSKGYSIAECPHHVSTLLSERKDKSKLFTYRRFFEEIFIPNIREMNSSVRNSQLLFVLGKVQKDPQDKYKWVVQALMSCACIPAAGTGDLVKPSHLIDIRAGHIAPLYDPMDGRFPDDSFTGVLNALVTLRMITNELPIDDLCERAHSIAKIQDEMKCNERIVSLLYYLHCIENKTVIGRFGYQSNNKERNDRISALKDIPFLKCLSKPESINLPWYSHVNGKLLCPSELYPLKCSSVVFTQKPLFTIPANDHDDLDIDRLVIYLGIKNEPDVEMVLNHLCCLVAHMEDMKPDENTLQYIEKKAVFSSIYTSLNQYNIQTEHTDLIKSKLQDVKCVWQNKILLHPRQVSIHWDNPPCLPYLCQLSDENRKFKDFFILIGVLEKPSLAYMINLLSRIKQDFDDKPLESNVLGFVNVITKQISYYDSCKIHEIYLPDEDGILRLATKLSCDSNIKHEWIEELPVYDEFLSNGGHFIHKTIPRERAIRLGSYPLIEAVMREFEDENFLDGTEFGQSEELVDRLNGILKKYPADTSIFREFIQNADDAKATEIVFVLDHRVDHPAQRLLNDKEEWKELQTSPALCIFNDKPFSEDDINGICKLGKGGKGETSDTIGRFGIGFNVSYHVTDCPTFISFADENNPKNLCVFDPLRRYCYKATKAKPGRRWNLNKQIVEQFPDQFQPFLIDKISEMKVMADCFDNLDQGFVVFRLPLIRYKPIIRDIFSFPASTRCKNEKWFSEGKADSIFDMKKLLTEFKLSSENMLLFLNHIKNISVFEIKTDGKCCHHFTSTTTVDTGTTDISQHTTAPSRSMCQVTILHQVENSEECQTQWIISKRCGFGQHFPPNVYSKAQERGLEAFGGVAAKCNILTEPINGMLFCFLPMNIRNQLPVHLNAHFLIDDSRKHLDKLPGLEDWNSTIAEHLLVPAYCELIMTARDKVDGSDASIKWFYSLFPEMGQFNSSEASQLRIEYLFYHKILKDNLPILLDARELSDNPSNVNWLTPNDGMFCINDVIINSKLIRKAEDVKNVLIALKMPITCAPHEIFRCLAKISNVYGANGSVTPSKVLERLKCINLKQDGNEDVIRNNCELLLEFCLQNIDAVDVSNKLKGVPLLLTFDDKLSKDGKLFKSSFSRLLPDLHHLFIHPSLEESSSVSKSLKDGKAIISLPITFVSQNITLKNINCPVKLSDTDAELIKKLWEFFKQELYKTLQTAIISEDISRLFSHKAIIPTSDSLLYPPVLGKCVLRKTSYKSHVLSLMTKVGYKTMDFSILGLTELQFIHKVVGDTTKPCDVIKCFELMPPKIDDDLSFSKEEVNDIITLLSKADEIPGSVAAILKNLPLFQTVNNSYIRLSSGTCFFIKPIEVPDSGILKIQGNVKQVVLTTPSYYAESFYKKIISQKEYESANEGVISFYLRFIIPNISYLNDEELLTHLAYIKSNIGMLYTGLSPYKPIIDKLRAVPLITKDDGKRHLVSEFYDPDVPFHSVFQETKLPPRIWCEKLSVYFLRLLGLHSAVSPSLWLTKARKVADEGGRIVQANPPSKELVEKCNCLMKSFKELLTNADEKLSLNDKQKLSNDFIQFLTDASKIPFVFCPTPCDLLNDVKTITGHSVKHQYFIRFHESVCHRSANLTCLVRTVLPYNCNFILSINLVFMRTLSIREPINVKAVVNNLIKLTDYLSTVKVFMPTQELNDSVRRIKSVIEAHYSYLDKHLDEKIVKELVDKACILLTTDKSNFQLVKPSQLVLHIPPEYDFQPFCYRTPQELLPHSKLLKMLGVKEDLGPLQHMEMLASIFHEMAKGNKTLQEDEHFLKVCKDAYTALITSLRLLANDPPHIPSNFKIYLPSEGLQLTESTELVHNDIPWIATRLQNSQALKHKFLYPPLPDKNGQNHPPDVLRVKLLSTLAVEKLHDDVTIEVNRCVDQQLYQQKKHKHNCKAVEVLNETLTSQDFSRGIGRLYWHKNQVNPRTDKKFCIRLKALKELTIKCVNEIKTVIHFNNQIVDKTEDNSRLCYFENNNNKVVVYVTHKVSHFTEAKLFEDLAIEINKHLGHCIGDTTHIKAMLECYPNQISMVLDKREISPFNSQDLALETHISNEIGHEIPQDEVKFTREDFIITCNYKQNERVVYHFVKDGKFVFKIAKVISCQEKSSLVDKCAKLEIGKTDKDTPLTAEVPLLQIYKQLNTSQRVFLEEGASSQFTSPLTLAPIPTDKVKLVALIQQIFAANNLSCNNCSLTYLSLRLIAHLHYILVMLKKQPDLFLFIAKKIIKIRQNYNATPSDKDEEVIKALVRKLKNLSIKDDEVFGEPQSPPLTHFMPVHTFSPYVHSPPTRRQQKPPTPIIRSSTSSANVSSAIPSYRIRPPSVNVPAAAGRYGHTPYNRMTFATSDDQSPPRPNTSLRDAKIWLHQANADYLAARYLYESNAHQGEEDGLEENGLEENGLEDNGSEERATVNAEDINPPENGDNSSEINPGNESNNTDTMNENVIIANGNEIHDDSLSDDDNEEDINENDEVNNSDSTCRYPALICFLCHDVVEKSMKALMYAKCGLRTGLAENHHLLAVFEEMEKCNNTFISQEVKQVVKECILQVNNYGNKSRYPNYHMPPCVPAAVYTPDDARMCLESGRRVLAELRKIDQLTEVFDELPERAFSSLLSTVSQEEELPDYWEEHEDDDGDVKLVLLSSQSDEHYTIAVKFNETLPNEIVRIERIQNKLLWRKYFDCSRRMMKYSGNLGEKFLFHGTRFNKPELIYKGDSSFDMRFSHNGMWGHGNYFAVNASYSNSYSFDNGGYRQMLVANVLTGYSYFCPPNGSLRKPPFRPQTSQGVQYRYDSVSGNTGGSVVYITYENDKAYPGYIITYRR